MKNIECKLKLHSFMKRKSSTIVTKSLVSRKLCDIAHNLLMAQLSPKNCFYREGVISATPPAILHHFFFKIEG